MKIKNIKFSYIDSKYKLGPYLDYLEFLDVPSINYDDIVEEIQKSHPDYESIQLMSFNRT